MVRRNGVQDDGSIFVVPRRQLRPRKWHTTAFVGVTNEKRHDGWTTQAMLNWQHHYWDLRCGGGGVSLMPQAANGSSSLNAGQGASIRKVQIPSATIEERRTHDWNQQFEGNCFYALAHHSDNATHFKSGKMFYYWSRRSTEVHFLRTVWVYFGCPGHGKGAWDGFGAVVKQHTSRTIKNRTFKTTSGHMKSSIDVAGVYTITHTHTRRRSILLLVRIAHGLHTSCHCFREFGKPFLYI